MNVPEEEDSSDHEQPTTTTPDPSSDTKMLQPEWNEDVGKWVVKDPEGNQFEWDSDVQRYVPLVDPKAMEAMQAAYIENAQNLPEAKIVHTKYPNHPITIQETESKNTKKRKLEIVEVEGKKFMKSTSNTIYISGLPTDVTAKEIGEFCERAGVILKDPDTRVPKIKIYKDVNGQPKGDAMVTYFRPESIQIALEALDGAQIRLNYPVHIEEAKFELKKGSKTEKKKKKGPTAKKKGYDQQQELTWDEKAQLHVIVKHVFNAEEAKKQLDYYDELHKSLMEEANIFGPVKFVKVFERNPEGVVAFVFKSAWAAEKCLNTLNGQNREGRVLAAEFYDGYTDYFVPEKEEDMNARDKEWGEWLEGKEKSDTAEEATT